MYRPRTTEELWAFVGAHFGLYLPFRSWTDGHSSPFAFVADAFFRPGADLTAWSCRSGGKTLGASVIAALAFLFADGLEGRVLSGSEDQARHLYDYWRRWCDGVLADRLEGSPAARLTRVAGGRLEILAASQKRVRGPKVQLLFQDEVDEIDPDIAEAAAGMLASRGGTPARSIYASTWHRLGGPMGRLIRACPRSGVRLHKWNLWEAVGRCPPDRHDAGRGCEHCPLAADCVPVARRRGLTRFGTAGVAAYADGLFAVEDAAKLCRLVSRRTWDAEVLCRRPNPQGLVYYDFDETVHVRRRAPEALTCYRAIDWGYSVFVCLWLGVDRRETVWLLDTYKAEFGTLAQHAAYLNAHRIQDVEATYCDPAGRSRSDQTGRSDVEAFRRHGIACQYSLDPRWREVVNGIHLVRSLLRPAAGSPRLFVVDAPANRVFIDDMTRYVNRRVNNEYIDDPVKPQPADHTMDALRYFAVNRMAGAADGVVRLGAS
jgi:hypothetical protein